MTNKFVIPGKLPSLNDYTLACRDNRYKGGRMKAELDEQIGWSIIKAKREGTLHAVKMPVTVHFVWHEGTKRRDADNIAFAKKFVLDALVKGGILIDDSRRYVVGFTDTIIDDKTDFVEVEINEITVL